METPNQRRNSAKNTMLAAEARQQKLARTPQAGTASGLTLVRLAPESGAMALEPDENI